MLNGQIILKTSSDVFIFKLRLCFKELFWERYILKGQTTFEGHWSRTVLNTGEKWSPQLKPNEALGWRVPRLPKLIPKSCRGGFTEKRGNLTLETRRSPSTSIPVSWVRQNPGRLSQLRSRIGFCRLWSPVLRSFQDRFQLVRDNPKPLYDGGERLVVRFPDVKISSLLDMKLARSSTASCALALVYRHSVVEEEEEEEDMFQPRTAIWGDALIRFVTLFETWIWVVCG